MKIEELKQGQAVWVKGFVDCSVFGGCGGFIDFYNQDGNHCGHISRNNVREMKEEDIQLAQPKPEIPQLVAEWVNNSREADYEFDEWFDPDNQPLEVYKWLNCKNKRQADLNALALVTLIVNGPDAVTVEKEKLYRVKLNDHLYFKEFIDSMFPVFVIDDMPGDLDEAFIGKKELALKHAREFGGRLEEAEEVTE